MREILAKKWRDDKGTPRCRTLLEHTRDVLDAFTALFGKVDKPTTFAVRWCEFFGVNEVARFLTTTRTAAVLHDIGKANDGFQAMLLRAGQQLIRHEHLSGVLISRGYLWEWLNAQSGVDAEIALGAVVGHHLKARDDQFGQPQTEIDQLMRIDFRGGQLVRDLVGTAQPSVDVARFASEFPALWSYAEPEDGIADLSAALCEARVRLDDLDNELASNERRRRLLWAVRSGLIAADAAGSGLFREGIGIGEWIGGCFTSQSALDGDAIEQKVIQPRIDQLRNDSRWLGWNPFQEACGDIKLVPSRSLLLAPCGSGKTLAAWRWIKAQCVDRPRGCVIFLYPTRGTAAEGFRDYVSWAGPDEAALVHGTADLDLDGIQRTLPEERRLEESRLYSLRQWPKRLFSATVDQFLGFLQHGYGPTCHLPLLADSVVVFDEVHSYDRGMFSALIEFLKTFPAVPALCMTATMLNRRRAELQKHLTIINGLDLEGDSDRLGKIADYPRYMVETVPDEAAAESIVKGALKSKQRVLWVVNTVGRAQAIARRFAADERSKRLATKSGASLFCYHSRFKLAHRRDWHGAVVGAFKPGAKEEAVLAVTTQVCEMSLDLDADLLVTERAPATSLVQRMGRCCRDPEAHERNRTGKVVIYPPENRLPYTDQDMLGVDSFVAALARGKMVSQSKLEELLEEIPSPPELPKACRFVSSGPWAAMGEENFRDVDERNRSVVLPREVDEYVRLRDKRRRRPGEMSWHADALLLRVPRDCAEADQRLPRWLSVAKNGEYYLNVGFVTGE